jgi:tripartite-type tricarboxylate transporter receptor subunit TctC
MNRTLDRTAGIALIGLACNALPAGAQEKPAEYPRKPIRIVVGIAPSGGLDLMSRLGAKSSPNAGINR